MGLTSIQGVLGSKLTGREPRTVVSTVVYCMELDNREAGLACYQTMMPRTAGKVCSMRLP